MSCTWPLKASIGAKGIVEFIWGDGAVVVQAAQIGIVVIVSGHRHVRVLISHGKMLRHLAKVLRIQGRPACSYLIVDESSCDRIVSGWLALDHQGRDVSIHLEVGRNKSTLRVKRPGRLEGSKVLAGAIYDDQFPLSLT